MSIDNEIEKLQSKLRMLSAVKVLASEFKERKEEAEKRSLKEEAALFEAVAAWFEQFHGDKDRGVASPTEKENPEDMIDLDSTENVKEIQDAFHKRFQALLGKAYLIPDNKGVAHEGVVVGLDFPYAHVRFPDMETDDKEEAQIYPFYPVILQKFEEAKSPS